MPGRADADQEYRPVPDELEQLKQELRAPSLQAGAPAYTARAVRPMSQTRSPRRPSAASFANIRSGLRWS